MDLKSATIADLEKQRQEIENAIAKRKAEAVQDLANETLKKAQELGISTNDLVRAMTKKTAKRAEVKAKYANPKNSKETWSGRGHKPKWVQDALNAGLKLESLAVKVPGKTNP